MLCTTISVIAIDRQARIVKDTKMPKKPIIPSTTRFGSIRNRNILKHFILMGFVMNISLKKSPKVHKKMLKNLQNGSSIVHDLFSTELKRLYFNSKCHQIIFVVEKPLISESISLYYYINERLEKNKTSHHVMI